MMNVCKKVVMEDGWRRLCDGAEWLFCDDGRIVLGRDPLVGEMYKQVQRARQEAGAVVAMAGWQTGGLSVNKV
jgi:hypothetical protein